MTLTELLEQAKKAETPEQIESMELDLAAAQEILRQKKAKHATMPAGTVETDPLLTPKEVAAALRVSPWSAGEMIRRGTLASVPTSPGGKLRGVRRSVVEKYKADNERGATMPPRRK